MNTQRQHELKGGLLRALLWIALGGLFLLFSNLAWANKSVDRSGMLFPYYEAEEVLNSTVLYHYKKDTAALQANLKKLDSATQQYCKSNASLDNVKRSFASSYLAWIELSAVVMGPLLENNTVRQIDFRPLRVNLLERAIKKQPKGQQAMALVGSPAKGFPALEYLLEQPSFKAGSPQCTYAVEVVQDIDRTVANLKWSTLNAEMQLYFNQLVGALHNIAWERMEKPLLKNQDDSAAGRAVDWPYSRMNLTEKVWVAQWRSVSEMLVVQSQTVPKASSQLVPLEAYLRGLGQIELADTLAKHTDKAAAAMLANDTSKPATVAQSVKAVKVLKGFLEQEVAKGLKVSIQFSSSDGD